MWSMLLFLSVYRSGVSVYNVIHAALSVSLPFWSIGLQCDPCCSFCQLTVLEYRFTMWSMLLFLSAYRSRVSVYNVIHAALSVSLPFWSIGLQCDPWCSFCQFTVLEYRFAMIHTALSVTLPFWSISLQCDPCCSFCQVTVLEYRCTMWSMLLFLSVYRSGVSVYNVIHAALSVSLPFWSISLQCVDHIVNRYSRTVNWQKELHGSHCKQILQSAKLTERAAWITL
jgi:hypothetical protein